jgi:hypothetical protein
MRRVVLGLLGLTALIGVVGGAFAGGAVPGSRGCVLRSVDEREYVARNEALFATIPLPRHVAEAHANTWTHGIPAQNKCFPWSENGPPYEAFVTTRVYLREPGGPPLGFDQRVLRGRWFLEPNSPLDGGNFRRGAASLNVDTSDEGFLLRIDHRGSTDR